MRKKLLIKLSIVELKLYILSALIISTLCVFAGYILLINIDSDQLITKYLSPNSLYTIHRVVADSDPIKIQYLGEEQIYGIEIENQMPITEDFWDANPSDFLIDQLANIDWNDYKLKLKPIVVSDEVDIRMLPIPALGIEYLKYGNYPTTERQIALGELPAISYCMALQLDDCRELVGQNISLYMDGKEQVFEVSGITSGGVDLYANANNQMFDDVEQYSYYYKFKTKQAKCDFLRSRGIDFDYIDSSDYNQIGMRLKVSLLEFIVITLTYCLICIGEIRKMKLKINYYQYHVDWVLIGFTPILIYCLSIIVIYIFNYYLV